MSNIITTGTTTDYYYDNLCSFKTFHTFDGKINDFMDVKRTM